MKVARTLLAVGVLALTLFAQSTLGLQKVEASHGGGGPAPANSSFDAPSRVVGTPPTNHDFETGDLTGWDIISGSPSVQSGGPGGFYLELLPGDIVRSSAFSVPLDAQRVEYQISLGDADSDYLVQVRSGPSFGFSTTIGSESCANPFPWTEHTRSFHFWAGETVKLEIRNLGLCEATPSKLKVDDVGVMRLVFPHWTIDSGNPKSTIELRSGGPSGQYAYIPDHIAMFILSEPFVVPAGATRFGFKAKCDTPATNRKFDISYAILTGPDANPNTWISFVPISGVLCASMPDWTDQYYAWSLSFNIQGQQIKLRLEAIVSGNAVSIDEIGFNLAEEQQNSGIEPTTAGDPFQVTTGAFTHSNTDVLIPARGVPLEFTRYYNSQSSYSGALGFRWSHTYQMSLEERSNSDVYVRYDTGGSSRFKFVALEQPYTSPTGNHDTLVKHTDGTFTLTTTSQIGYDFDSSGRLDSISDRNGNTTALSYDVNGHLTSVTDPGGRQLTFSYDDPQFPDNITKITDPLPSPDTRTVLFAYDPVTEDLTDVTDVKGGTTTYTYSSSRMETLTDANGNIAVQNCYNDVNRVYKQFDAPPSVLDCDNPVGSSNQRLPLDVVVSSTNLAGATVPFLEDDPDAPDGNWATRIDKDDTLLHVGFPTPAGDPTQGATLQEFQVLLRKDASGGNDPTYDLELWESGGGAPLATLVSGATLSSDTGVVVAATWDAALLGTADGSAVELKVVGHRSGGNPNLRRMVEVGAVEWNVEFDSSVAATLVSYDSPTDGQTTVTDPRGAKNIYTFDSSFRTTDIEDHLGNVVHNDYDADNNVSCVTDQLLNKTGFAYDSTGNVTQIIDALNTDASCQLKMGGVSSTFTYTANNDVDLETDPLGRQTDYIYDGSGNLTRVVRKDAGAVIKALTCFERDSAGLMTALVESTDLVLPAGPTDPCTGNRTLFEYDANGNQTAVVDPRFSGQPTPPKTIFSPDLGGRVLTITNELSHTTTYTYDDQNNVLTVADNLGNTTSNAYDAKDNLKTVTDANRQTAGATPETGAQCGAAGTGNGVNDDPADDSVIDDGCPSAIYNYDNGDRLIEVIDALGGSTTYGYDAVGNRTSVTNARGKITTYAYDTLDRLESVTDPLSRVTSYGYDAASNLSQRTDAKREAVGPAETGTDCGSAGAGNGVDEDADTVPDDGCPTAVYTYDALSRLTRVDYSDQAVDYTYNDVGSRLTMVDPTGTTTYVYDALNRPTSVTFPGPSLVSYQYDNVGTRSRITYPDTKFVDYTYDEADNLKTVTDWLTKQTVYTYDNAGNLTKTDLPNGAFTDFGYDIADRLTSVVNKDAGGTISSFTYSLDANGNRTQMVDLSGTHAYDYDDLYRLTQVDYPDPATDTYDYDAVGNREKKNSTVYTYDDADQMLTAGGVSYGYDANGNQTSRGSDTFTYDHENRLTDAVMGGATFSSTYNGDGYRTSHTEGVTTTSYTWDVAADLPVVMQDDDNTYVYGLDLISTTDGAGVQTYSLNDGLGSTTDLTDGSANPTDDYSYDVFGTIRSQSGSSDNYWLFTGEQRDGQPGVAGGVQRLPLDVVVSSTNLTGATVANLDDDPDDPDANWATATSVADTSIQVGFPTPPTDPKLGAGLQQFQVLLRKDAAGGNDPTYDIELWETGGGAPLATLVSGATLSSDTGEVVAATWDASLLGSADGSAVELRIVGDRSNGPTSKRRTVEVGAVEWNVDLQGVPGSELYFLRARYYDPETGRFLSQDPFFAMAGLPQSLNRYVYGLNNPVLLIDPYGLFGFPKIPNPVDAVKDAAEAVADSAADAAEWTASQVATAGKWTYQNAIVPVIDFLGTCEGKLLATGVLFVAVGGGVGGLYLWTARAALASGTFEGVLVANHLGWLAGGGSVIGLVGVGAISDACFGSSYLPSSQRASASGDSGKE